MCRYLARLQSQRSVKGMCIISFRVCGQGKEIRIHDTSVLRKMK